MSGSSPYRYQSTDVSFYPHNTRCIAPINPSTVNCLRLDWLCVKENSSSLLTVLQLYLTQQCFHGPATSMKHKDRCWIQPTVANAEPIPVFSTICQAFQSFVMPHFVCLTVQFPVCTSFFGLVSLMNDFIDVFKYSSINSNNRNKWSRKNVEFEDKSIISYVSSTFSILNTYIVLQVKSGAQTLLKQIPVFTDFLLRRFSKCFVISFLNLIIWHTYCK
jgi:hypothetical protein